MLNGAIFVLCFSLSLFGIFVLLLLTDVFTGVGPWNWGTKNDF